MPKSSPGTQLLKNNTPVLNSVISTTLSSNREVTSSVLDDGAPPKSTNTIARAPVTSSNQQKLAASPLSSRLIGGGSNSIDYVSSVAKGLQLQKSASVSFNNPQTKNLKASIDNSNGTTVSPPRVSSSNQTAGKPRVPAKPAQLLDHQRNSIN